MGLTWIGDGLISFHLIMHKGPDPMTGRPGSSNQKDFRPIPVIKIMRGCPTIDGLENNGGLSST